MLLPRLFGLDDDDYASSSSTSSAASPPSSSFFPLPTLSALLTSTLSDAAVPPPSSSTATPPAAIATTTVYEVVYVVVAPSLAAAASSAALDAAASASSTDVSLAAVSDEYAGLTFAQLNGIVLSLFLTLLVATVIILVSVRQAERMKRFAEGADDSDSSGDSDGGFDAKTRAGLEELGLSSLGRRERQERGRGMR
ncbi:hypothetical protein JCM8097_004929 [Rhodosporidiobolus ruineniae]